MTAVSVNLTAWLVLIEDVLLAQLSPSQPLIELDVFALKGILDGSKCVPSLPKCPEGMERINGKCVCKDGYYIEAGICKATPKCPVKAKWNQDKLVCECSVAGEYLINGACTSCKANEGWNGKDCACTTGYFKINGACVTCDLILTILAKTVFATLDFTEMERANATNATVHAENA